MVARWSGLSLGAHGLNIPTGSAGTVPVPAWAHAGRPLGQGHHPGGPHVSCPFLIPHPPLIPRIWGKAVLPVAQGPPVSKRQHHLPRAATMAAAASGQLSPVPSLPWRTTSPSTHVRAAGSEGAGSPGPQHISAYRRTSTFPTTATSPTSGPPPRPSPEGSTPSSRTSGPLGFSSMRFSAGVRYPMQVLAPNNVPNCGQSGRLPPWSSLQTVSGRCRGCSLLGGWLPGGGGGVRGEGIAPPAPPAAPPQACPTMRPS